MARIDIDDTDVEELRAYFVAVSEGITMSRAIARAGRAVAEKTMAMAKELTPVDTGALRSTGRVENEVIDRDGWNVDLTFGGPSAVQTNRGKFFVDYETYVHEKLIPHAVGEAKFLEKAMLAHDRELKERVANAIMEHIVKTDARNLRRRRSRRSSGK